MPYKKHILRSILTFVLALALTCALAACGKVESEATEAAETADKSETTNAAPLNVGALKGPTGIGMCYAFEDTEHFNIQLFDSPDQVTAKLISGELDAAAVPSNLGAVLYNKTSGAVKCIGINTGSTLYIVGKDVAEPSFTLADLSGKTIYASGQGGVPEYVLKALLEKEDINDAEITWLASHQDVVSTVLAAEGEAIALLPEPNVSLIESKGAEAGAQISTLINIGAIWEETYNTLPMGILLARTEVIESRGEALDALIAACSDSTAKVLSDIDAAATKVVELGIIPSEGLAKKAIPSCNIMFESDGETMKGILEPFYEVLYNYEASAVGGKLPAEDYYGR